MNTYSVYIHITPNNKKYIGITKREVEKRWANGRAYARNKHFLNAINKYGWDNITHEILFNEVSRDSAIELEKELIKKYKTFNKEFGYNKTEGGEGTLGVKKTKEQREAQSERMKNGNAPMYGKKLTEEAKNKIRKAQKGRKHTEETRKKVSEAGKGRKMSDKCRGKLQECNFNRMRTEKEKKQKFYEPAK